MSGSTVTVTVRGVDVTASVLFSKTSFEHQRSAVAGTFQMTLKDPDQILGGDFITGSEVVLTVDGTPEFGGYLTQVARSFAFPTDRTDDDHGGPGAVKTRQWKLSGVDYNILFDKRVLRFGTASSGAGFLKQLPSFAASRTIGDLIRNELCPKYLDLPDGFTYGTDTVEDIGIVVPNAVTAGKVWAWQQQGTPWRKQMEEFLQFYGAIWYIDASKRLHLHLLENAEARWGFSDVPNKRVVADIGPGFQGATYGFRDLDTTEDGSYLANDALIWGGSEWAGSSGGTVFARRQDAVDGGGVPVSGSSIDLHGRWQLAEAHFGEQGYGIQEGVTGRADVIVTGSAGGQEDQQYGYRNPQSQLRLSWFSNDVPIVGGARDHLYPGQLVTIWLFTLGVDLDHPLTFGGLYQLPLRSVTVSFVNLDPNGDAYVRFDGYFGLQADDPWTLWKYLLKAKGKTSVIQISSVNNASDSALYGSFGDFFPLEPTDGVRTEFSIFITVDGMPQPVGYIAGTTSVSVNGLVQRNQIDYYESDPENGKITFVVPPLATDWVRIRCRTMAA